MRTLLLTLLAWFTFIIFALLMLAGALLHAGGSGENNEHAQGKIMVTNFALAEAWD